MVMKEKALSQIRENKFDLLQDIKTVNIGNEMPITLSISIGSGGGSYMDCYGICPQRPWIWPWQGAETRRW